MKGVPDKLAWPLGTSVLMLRPMEKTMFGALMTQPGRRTHDASRLRQLDVVPPRHDRPLLADYVQSGADGFCALPAEVWER